VGANQRTGVPNTTYGGLFSRENLYISLIYTRLHLHNREQCCYGSRKSFNKACVVPSGGRGVSFIFSHTHTIARNRKEPHAYTETLTLTKKKSSLQQFYFASLPESLMIWSAAHLHTSALFLSLHICLLFSTSSWHTSAKKKKTLY